MFTKTIISTALLASLIAPLAANAGEVENRIHHEQARINQGLQSGSLTRAEYRRLDNGLDRIQAQRNRDLRRNDGHLTAAQYARLNREENRLSGRIYRQKHDGEDR
jgi:hypothetical protein